MACAKTVAVGCSISGLVFGSGCHLLDQFGAQIFKRILKLDFTSNGVAVINDVWYAKFLFKNDVPTLRSDGDSDSIGEGVHATLEGTA
jgi:hypothetical protein